MSQRASGSNRFASGTAGTLAGAATRSVIDGTDFGDNILATLPDIVTSLLSYGLEEVSKPTIIDGVITIGGSVEKDGLPGGWGATAPLTSTTKLGIREDVIHFDIAPAAD